MVTPNRISSSPSSTDGRSPSALQGLEDQISGFVLDMLGHGPNLKKPKKKATSVEGQVKEWVRFAQNSRVISGSTDTVKFDPYPYQIELCRAFLTNRGICVGKIRQAGITETFANIFLWRANRNPAYTGVVFSQGGEATSKVAERVKRMASSNPFCTIEKSNTREVALKNGGRILFRTCSPGSSRGLSSVHDILFDEWAFVPVRGLDRTLWSDITPAQEMVGDEARIAVVSTPPERPNTQYMDILTKNNGDNDYIDITSKMRSGEIAPTQWWIDENGWCKFFIHWKAHPVFSKRKNHLEQARQSLKLDNVKLQREVNLNFEIKDSTSMVDLDDCVRYQWPDSMPANPWFILQSWDTAQSDKPGSAKWSGTTYYLYGNKIYLVDSVLASMTFTKGLKQVTQTAIDWKPNLILIENKSSGADIIDTIRQDPHFPYPLLPVEPLRGDGFGDDPKVRRFAREVHQIHAGKFHLPVYAPWLTEAEKALQNFPDKEYRDFVDGLSQALHYIRTQAQESLSYSSSFEDTLCTVEDVINDYM